MNISDDISFGSACGFLDHFLLNRFPSRIHSLRSLLFEDQGKALTGQSVPSCDLTTLTVTVFRTWVLPHVAGKCVRNRLNDSEVYEVRQKSSVSKSLECFREAAIQLPKRDPCVVTV
jgi:hypothetical protein